MENASNRLGIQKISSPIDLHNLIDDLFSEADFYRFESKLHKKHYRRTDWKPEVDHARVFPLVVF